MDTTLRDGEQTPDVSYTPAAKLQLGLSPEKHRDAVAQTARNARRKRIRLSAYLEDWSNGVRDSFDYVFAMVQQLRESGVERVYLADTLGVFSPDDTIRYVGLMTATWPD